MSLLVFDIGGTAVKYALFKNNELRNLSSFPTPGTWEGLVQELVKVKQQFPRKELIGAAFSSPGAVDVEKGEIHGISAVPYIHNFPIISELEEVLGLPVTIENDANCAALAELAFGAAQDCQNVLFFVIGSGVGGAVVIDRQLQKGRNLFGGEFGYMLMDGGSTLSERVSPVHVAKRFSEKQGLENPLSGKELFDLADQGDTVASEAVDDLFASLALGIFNTCLVVNPDKVLIGGGISKRQGLVEELNQRTQVLKEQTEATDMEVEIVVCQFYNDANLLGAAAHFLKNKGEQERKRK